jgi:uncharacterized RDD family membrane protein YckC
MEENYPSLSQRIQSSFIDLYLIILVMFGISSILEKFNNVPDWIRILLFVILFVILFVAYEPLCITLGCTLGNYIKKIRVRKYGDTKNSINFFQAVVRYIVKIALGWLSFLTIHNNPEKRALHDMASGSVMIKL